MTSRRTRLWWGIPQTLVGGISVAWLADSGSLGLPKGTEDFIAPVAALAAWVGPLVLLVLLVRTRDRKSKTEAPADTLAPAKWSAASAIREFLVAGRAPRPLEVWEIVPWPGEVFWLDGECAYSRFYGQNGQYTPAQGLIMGRPAFVVAGLAAAALSNASARRRAAAQSIEQWRERQVCRILVSDQRVACRINNQWLSFNHSAVVSINPQLDDWSLFFEFDSSPPLLLDGLDVPAVAVLVVGRLYGPQALETHPGFARLRSGH